MWVIWTHLSTKIGGGGVITDVRWMPAREVGALGIQILGHELPVTQQFVCMTASMWPLTKLLVTKCCLLDFPTLTREPSVVQPGSLLVPKQRGHLLSDLKDVRIGDSGFLIQLLEELLKLSKVLLGILQLHVQKYSQEVVGCRGG